MNAHGRPKRSNSRTQHEGFVTRISHAALEAEVQQLLARILKLSELPAGELQRGDVAEWDSLKHVEIVFALEDRYNVQFDESEFALMRSTSAIAALLQPRLET